LPSVIMVIMLIISWTSHVHDVDRCLLFTSVYWKNFPCMLTHVFAYQFSDSAVVVEVKSELFNCGAYDDDISSYHVRDTVALL